MRRGGVTAGRGSGRPARPAGSNLGGAVLALQAAAGNQAVAAALGPGTVPVQCFANPFKKKAKKPEPLELTPAEKKGLLDSVKDEVRALVEKKEALVEGGMDPSDAELAVYGDAPAHLKPYLPLMDEFDIVKRKVDRGRNDAGAAMVGKTGKAVEDRAKKLGYTVGSGVGVDIKAKDVTKQLKEKRAERRAFEKKAYEKLVLKREQARSRKETAEAGGDRDAVVKAEAELTKLNESDALDREISALEVELGGTILKKIGQAETKFYAEHGTPANKAEKWEIARLAREEALDDLMHNRIEPLETAGKVVGGIGMAAKPLSKGVIKAGEKLQVGGPFEQIATGAGAALKGVCGAFSGVVKIVGKAQDLQGGRYDKDTKIELASAVLGSTAKLAKSASKAVDAFTGPMGLLASSAPAFEAVPGLGIVANVLSMAASALTMVPPAQRVAALLSAIASSSDGVLVTALGRTSLENGLQVSTEAVVIAANIVMLAANIAELASAGGLGVPAAVKALARGAIVAKKVADAVTYDLMASKTQKARQAGVAQDEGSGKKLIGTDVTYAVDTIIVKAKGRPADPEALKVLESYGLTRAEIARYDFDELHEKLMDKLDTDDDQKTHATQAKEKVTDLKDKILGDDDKEEEWRSLEDEIHDPKKEKGIADKLKKIPKAITGLPGKITGELSEKDEKATRVRMVKNMVGYRGDRDRGRWSAFKHFMKGGDSIRESEERLREYIVARIDSPQKEVLLAGLLTNKETAKTAKKGKAKREAEGRAKEPLTDRVVTSWLPDLVSQLSVARLWQLLEDPKVQLTRADQRYVYWTLEQRGAAVVS